MEQQTNDLTDLTDVVVRQPMGGKYKDKYGKYQDIPIDPTDFKMDLSGISTGSSSGGNTGGGTDTDHPTSGADYYPGSVYDGTISGRTLLYSGITSTTDKTNIVFPESVGAGLRLLGDGIQLRLKLLKTLVTRGVVDTSSTEISLVYDILDKQIKGTFVTVAPLPASIKKEDILSGNELVIPLDGVGEGEQSAEIKSPELHLQYDSKTNSINIWNVQGYALDNLTDTKTGTLYDVQATLINNFYVQDVVAQLPTDVSLFSGDINGEVDLSGTNTYFDNIGEALKITVEPYLFMPDPSRQNSTTSRLAISQFGLPKEFVINKDDLILNNSIHINGSVPAQLTVVSRDIWLGDSNGWHGNNMGKTTISVKNQSVLVTNGKVNVTLVLNLSWTSGSTHETADAYMKVTSVQTNKDGE